MNPKQKSIIIGALIGAVVGALGGYLFTRGVDLARLQDGSQKVSLRAVPPGEMAKVAIGAMGVLRGIAELGERL